MTVYAASVCSLRNGLFCMTGMYLFCVTTVDDYDRGCMCDGVCEMRYVGWVMLVLRRSMCYVGVATAFPDSITTQTH